MDYTHVLSTLGLNYCFQRVQPRPIPWTWVGTRLPIKWLSDTSFNERIFLVQYIQTLVAERYINYAIGVASQLTVYFYHCFSFAQSISLFLSFYSILITYSPNWHIQQHIINNLFIYVLLNV